MKQKILDALKAKFEGVSDAILDRIATKLATTVTTDDQVKTAVEGYTWQQVIEGYGDSRATEAQRTAITNYETKHKLKDGKPVNQEPPKPNTPPTPEPNDPKPDDMPAWAKTLLDTNKQLTERLNTMEAQRLTTDRKKQLNDVIAKLPAALRKGYERTNVDGLKDEEFTQLLTDITGEVDGIVKQTQQKGAIFGRPSVAGGKSNKEELSKEQQEAIAARSGKPTDGAQPF